MLATHMGWCSIANAKRSRRWSLAARWLAALKGAKPIEEIRDSVIAEANQYSHDIVPSDDVTLVVAEYHSSP